MGLRAVIQVAKTQRRTGRIMRHATAGNRRLFQVAIELTLRLAAIGGLCRHVNMSVRTSSLQHEGFEDAFAVDPLQVRWQGVLVPLADQILTRIPHPSPAQGCFMIRQIFPCAVFIDAATGHRHVHVRIPVEPPAVGVDRTENTDD